MIVNIVKIDDYKEQNPLKETYTCEGKKDIKKGPVDSLPYRICLICQKRHECKLTQLFC